jgi:outer membrane protein assembly factor BamE
MSYELLVISYKVFYTKKLQLILGLIFTSLALVSCSLAPYKATIYQGHAINKKSLALLKVNMSPLEVISIIGAPQIQDNFSPNRWDYVYFYKNDDQKYFIQHMVLMFSQSKLLTIGQVTENPLTLPN